MGLVGRIIVGSESGNKMYNAERNNAMKKTIVKTVSFILVLMLVCAYFPMGALANEEEGTQSTRSVEYAYPTTTTEMWRYLPYSQIDNDIQCYVYTDDTLYVKGYYRDVYGTLGTCSSGE